MEELPDFSKYKALLIDDHEFIRTIISDQLEKLNFDEIIQAENGEEGLKRLSNDIDIIICDIKMEPIDGFEFVKKMREMGAPISDIPLIFLTGKADTETIQQAMNLGVSGYITKPVSPQKLTEKVTQLIRKKENKG